MKLPTLYRRDSHGNIRSWTIEVVGERYRTVAGVQDGKLETTKWTTCAGKNKGRSNATTGATQASADARSKWQKQVDKKYNERIEDIDTPKYFEPMTCHKYKDHSDKIVFPCYSQPKLDGMRNIIDNAGSWSRYGKPVVSAPHIRLQLEKLGLLGLPMQITYDGELYHHKEGINFEKVISCARMTKPTEEDLKESARILQYWVYDLYDAENKNMSFADRLTKLALLIGTQHPSLVLVATTVCHNQEELDTKYKEYLDAGYEGQIIRNPAATYQNKRTTDVIKRKEFIDEEFELLDLQDGKGDKVGIATTATFKHPNGETFDTGMIGSDPYCRELLQNKKKYIGQQCTVRYQNLTEKNTPRFGKMVIVRTYE